MDKMPLLKTFALNIKFERMKLGYTQEKVAEELEFSTVYISNVESGKCDLSLSNAQKFASFYGKSLDYLITEKK
ncbi:helix-turn-helix transcriptional regulator [bacterium]|nr:helix-turn-helix transcriptional regulator [bacterium]